MPTNRTNEMMVYCSFCGKSQEEVQKIIAGNNAFICNECVELAQEIIREELAEEVLADLSEVPKPQELLNILNHYVIGQDRAKRALAVAVYNHYKRINFHDNREDEEDVELQKSNILMIGPTGSGKTSAVIKMIKHTSMPVIYVTNRKMTLCQFKKDYIKASKGLDVPAELLDSISLGENIIAITYQELAETTYKYKGKKYLLILDEVHCLLEDANFSVYAEKIIRYLKANRDNTARIYLTATPDAVTPVIAEIECESGQEQALFAMDWDTNVKSVFHAYASYKTRLKMVYSMESNWNYINFKLYTPDDTKELADYIKRENEQGTKSLIYVNDISKGKVLQEVLGNTQHIYSDEDKRAEIAEIAQNERFSDRNLITTKVAENGVSLHDDELNLIVVETLDPITLKQVIGRARVNRKNPREITVLIPDYSMTDIGNAIASAEQQMKMVKEVKADPDLALEYAAKYPALVYYDSKVKHPVVNTMAEKALAYQIAFLRGLRKDPEKPHAFAQAVLELYGKKPVISDDMFLYYDRILDFKTKAAEAFDTYKNSEKNAECLDRLKAELKVACNSTKVYNDGKQLTSNIQISTINDILKAAGIAYEIKAKVEVFNIASV